MPARKSALRHVYFQAPLIKSHARCYHHHRRHLHPRSPPLHGPYCKSASVEGEIIAQSSGRARSTRPNLVSIHGARDRAETSSAGLGPARNVDVSPNGSDTREKLNGTERDRLSFRFLSHVSRGKRSFPTRETGRLARRGKFRGSLTRLDIARDRCPITFFCASDFSFPISRSTASRVRAFSAPRCLRFSLAAQRASCRRKIDPSYPIHGANWLPGIFDLFANYSKDDFDRR